MRTGNAEASGGRLRGALLIALLATMAFAIGACAVASTPARAYQESEAACEDWWECDPGQDGNPGGGGPAGPSDGPVGGSGDGWQGGDQLVDPPGIDPTLVRLASDSPDSDSGWRKAPPPPYEQSEEQKQGGNDDFGLGDDTPGEDGSGDEWESNGSGNRRQGTVRSGDEWENVPTPEPRSNYLTEKEIRDLLEQDQDPDQLWAEFTRERARTVLWLFDPDGEIRKRNDCMDSSFPLRCGINFVSIDQNLKCERIRDEYELGPLGPGRTSTHAERVSECQKVEIEVSSLLRDLVELGRNRKGKRRIEE